MSAPQVTFAPGQRLGNYELLLELAAGGTATVGIAVYRGAAGFERLVVVKRVHRHLTRDAEFSAMLLDEARLASSIRHPNVVPVTDVVRVEDEVVLVMDYVDSVSLSQLVKEGEKRGARLTPGVVSRIVLDALAGLHGAHEAVDMRRQPLGIVHRDVSPQNVVIGVDGVSRVIDFGIAKARSRISHTRAGTIKGKCAYMAPEQIEGLSADRRSDAFAAGIVLWEALTGARLFRGEDDFDEMRRVMRAPIPAPSSLVPGLGPDVDAVVAQALARPPADRFQTALAFARALEQALPPASPDAVAAEVTSLCATELEYRHARLAAILGDELEKLSPKSLGRAATAPEVPARLSREATVRLAPVQPAAAPAKPVVSATLRSGEATPPAPALAPAPAPPAFEGLEADVPGVPARSLTPVVIAVMAASLLLGAGGAFVWLQRGSGGAGAAKASAPVTVTATAPVTAPAPAPAPATVTATATATATVTATATATAPATVTATAPASVTAPATATATASVTAPSPPHPAPALKTNPYGH